MQIHDLRDVYQNVEHPKSFDTYLVPSLITNKNDKGSVVFLDIVIDQNWYSRIQLLAHSEKQAPKYSTQCLVTLGARGLRAPQGQILATLRFDARGQILAQPKEWILSTVNHLLVVFLYILFDFLSPAPLKESEPSPNSLLFILQHRTDHEKTLGNTNQFLLFPKTVPGTCWLSLQCWSDRKLLPMQFKWQLPRGCWNCYPGDKCSLSCKRSWDDPHI